MQRLKNFPVLAIFFVFLKLSVLFGQTPCQVQEPLLVPKAVILESFFRALLEESQGGYVLYGNKPVCMEGILPKEENLFMVAGTLHKHSTILKEGLKIWQTLPLSKSQNRYFIQSFDTPNYGWKEFVLINRKELISVIKENMHLFQYVIGPEIDANTLFQRLIKSREGFSSVLNHDKVLTGIVLGFGTQNALYVGRSEIISETLSRQPNALKERESDFLVDEVSLQNELTALGGNIFTSNDLVPKGSPLIPWFGCLKNKKTNELLNGYVDARKKVQRVLKSDRFLIDILFRFFEDKKLSLEIFKTLSTSQVEIKNVNWAELIARSLIQGVPYQDEAWMNHFIEGIQAQNEKNIVISQAQWDDLLDASQEATENLPSEENPSEKERCGIAEELRLQVARQLGARTWAHFKYGEREGYRLQAIITALRSIQNNALIELSSEETDLLTHLHWKIYHISKADRRGEK